jgi:NAD(P)-dependent dehydrogenase (short-subunit alcohol dehydrogenase family)
LVRFQNKVALVTGAGRGIGRAVAELFASEGATVALVARTASEVEAAAAGIAATGARTLAITGDISQPEDIEAFVGRVGDELGEIDVLVNNAGISITSIFTEATFEEWNRVMLVNLYGAVHCSRAVARAMIRRGQGGAIVNVSSIHGYRAEPGASSYDVAKGGLDQLTRALAVELAPHGIRVNGVAPGFVETSMAVVDGVNEHETEWFQSVYVGRRKIPLARPADPTEIAAPILFLASSDASYITGQTVVVDGGLSVTF